MRAARRRHSGKGRAVPERCPSISVLSWSTRFTGAFRVGHSVRRRPGLKVLFTTGYTRNAIVHHGRLDPGVEMIGKPFSIDELTRKVRAILDGSA
jgi:DNA-binding response OmpR family regulator